MVLTDIINNIKNIVIACNRSTSVKLVDSGKEVENPRKLTPKTTKRTHNSVENQIDYLTELRTFKC